MTSLRRLSAAARRSLRYLAQGARVVVGAGRRFGAGQVYWLTQPNNGLLEVLHPSTFRSFLERGLIEQRQGESRVWWVISARGCVVHAAGGTLVPEVPSREEGPG